MLCKSTTVRMTNFEVVHITNIYKEIQRIQCNSINDYMVYLNENPAKHRTLRQTN